MLQGTTDIFYCYLIFLDKLYMGSWVYMNFRCKALCLAIFTLATSNVLHARTGADAKTITPNNTALAIYVPPSFLEARRYDSNSNMWIEPGNAFESSINIVGRKYFPNLNLIKFEPETRYGLLLDLAPKWETEQGKLKLIVQFNVFAPDGIKLQTGEQKVPVVIKGNNMTAAAYAAAGSAIALIMPQVVNQLQPDTTKFPDIGISSSINREMLVDKSKPVRTGTAFFINDSGDMLTAAHVQRGCTHLEATLADQVFPVFHQKSSDLLDVAVLKSNRKTPRKLPLRSGQVIELGEFVTSVGYPLQSILATSATITRGNISAEGGIQGSFGLFQFSAPIQPGNSGGPIVSDNGELLGMAVSTLSAESLSKRGLIPQNVNFALNAKYIAAFLSREKIAFNEVQPKTPGEMRIANEAALSTTAKLSCYQ